MSFSGKVKEELSKQTGKTWQCQNAECAALISMCGAVVIHSNDSYSLKIHTENLAVARKCFTLLRKTYKIEVNVAIRRNKTKAKVSYFIIVKRHEEAMKVLHAIRLLDEEGEIREELSLEQNPILQEKADRRAFLRGAFLASGSMSEPEKAYHFEIACATEEKAQQIQEVMKSFLLEAKIISRKRYYVVYLKEGTQIADALNVMEAHVALMEFENVRILKEMRNEVNRKVNCETANLNKTVSAAVKQLEDIRWIQRTIGFEELPDTLREAAVARLNYPDASLKELGNLVTPAVGKSGIHHRLHKLSEIAEKLRPDKEEME